MPRLIFELKILYLLTLMVKFCPQNNLTKEEGLVNISETNKIND
jgi:hypothetical protein